MMICGTVLPRRCLFPLSLLALLGLAVGCSGNAPPEFSYLGPQRAYVGARFQLQITAVDPDRDPLQFSVSCPTLNLAGRARILPAGEGALLTWTPLAADVGVHLFEFVASDGSAQDTVTVELTVKPASVADSAPVFRKPLGEGTTLDLSQASCITFEVVVEDPDSAKVELRQEQPIAGSKLTTSGALRAVFRWCPSAAQASQQRYVVHLVADDHDNAPVHKYYAILLRSGLPQNCPGDAPVIAHTPPGAQYTTSDLLLKATITDDKGVKGRPVVYYTTQAPSSGSGTGPVNYAGFSQVSMSPDSAVTSGFRATVPNPLTGSTSETGPQTLYYVIVAEDDDDQSGSCDHRTVAPSSGTYSVTVSAPKGSSCSSSKTCSAGQVCSGGSCVSDACTPTDKNGDKLYWEQGSCPSSHFCPGPGPNLTAGSHCAATCSKDADCPSWARCKVFDTKWGCGEAGSGGVGSACKDFTDCAGMAMCLSWKGGYCSISDCDTAGNFSGACPTGSRCIPVGDGRFKTLQKHWLCLKQCNNDSNCRSAEGYRCTTVKDDLGGLQKVCWPGS